MSSATARSAPDMLKALAILSVATVIRILYNKLLSENYWFWNLNIFGKLLQLKKEGSSIIFLEIWANLSESDIGLFRCVQGGEEGNQFT